MSTLLAVPTKLWETLPPLSRSHYLCRKWERILKKQNLAYPKKTNESSVSSSSPIVIYMKPSLVSLHIKHYDANQ